MDESNKLILPYQLPENLESLNRYEEELRKQSIFEINKSLELVNHLGIVHASLDIIYNLNIAYENPTDDELIIQCLGTRLFNSVVSSLKLLLTGYYQNSFALQRDILETGFLLDFFSIDRTRISDWKNSNERERLRKYGPKTIRCELDKRDKFKGEKRRQEYQKLCGYATHPTYPGFKLIAPNGLVKIGPFFKIEYLKSALEGLVMYVPNFAIIYISYFNLKNLSPEIFEIFLKEYMDFLDKAKAWSKKYFGIDLSHFNTDEIRELLKQI